MNCLFQQQHLLRLNMLASMETLKVDTGRYWITGFRFTVPDYSRPPYRLISIDQNRTFGWIVVLSRNAPVKLRLRIERNYASHPKTRGRARADLGPFCDAYASNEVKTHRSRPNHVVAQIIAVFRITAIDH